MRVLDLFSGIGGFSLGLERSGMRTVAFCESDEFCRAVLKKNWPNIPCHDDIKKLGAKDVEPVELICGGYPCQPFSLAGKRGGEEDDRHLWPEMRRLIAELRPNWVIGENVAGHVSMGLDNVLSDLEALGYACQSFVVPACAVDAKHRRDRVWVIANTSCEQHQGDSAAIRRATSEGFYKDVVADVDIERRHGRSTEHGAQGRSEFKRNDSAWPDPNTKSRADGICVPKPIDGQEQEFGKGALGVWREWPPEPRVGRVAHGIPGRVDRIKGLGNAVVPQIPELIGRAIMRTSS